MFHTSVSNMTLSSALRYGLSELKPVEETFVEKIGKFKLIHKITRLVPKKQYSFEDYTAIFYEDVLRSISTPPKFEEDAIYRHLIQMARDGVRELGLKDRIDRLEALREVTSNEGVAERQDILIDLTKELATMMDREEQSRYYIEKFLNSSNFQLSYFGELMRGSQTYGRFLNLMERELRILRSFVATSMRRSPQSAIRRHREKRRILRPIVDACDLFSPASSSLKTYVEICNSDKVEQIFEPKPLDADKLDKQEFQRLRSIYISRLDNLRDKIFEQRPELFTSKIDFNQPINSMFRKMITLTAST